MFIFNLTSKWNKPSRKEWLNVDILRENRKEFIENSKLILKLQQRFRNEKQNVFTEEVNKIALSANNDKIIQSINSLETCLYGIN